jgi:ribosomal protein S14
MASFLLRALQRLREDRFFSRNRHYRALSSPEGRRALRIHRHLRSLEHDLSQPDVEAQVVREAERVRLTLRGRRVSRTAWLSRAEFRILCGNPEVRRVLGVAEEE